MNKDSSVQADMPEPELSQLRLLGELLCCLDAAGHDPEDTRQLQLMLAARLHQRAGGPVPELQDAQAQQAVEALLDSLNVATLIARSSLGTPAARQIRDRTTLSRIAEILRRRDSQSAPSGLPTANPMDVPAGQDAPATPVRTGDHRPAADTPPRNFRRPADTVDDAPTAVPRIIRAKAPVRGGPGNPRFRRLARLADGIAAVSISILLALFSLWWILIIGAVFLVSTAGTHDAGIGALISVASGFLLWLVSVWLTPFRKCRICKGTGRFNGVLSTWATRQCPSCGGRGVHRRYFVTTVFGDKLTRDEARARKARASWNRPRS